VNGGFADANTELSMTDNQTTSVQNMNRINSLEKPQAKPGAAAPRSRIVQPWHPPAANAPLIGSDLEEAAAVPRRALDSVGRGKPESARRERVELHRRALDGSDATTLTDFTWQALLVVNVASQCGFTKQDAGLEALHERYRGFSVLGFPSNQFGAQEPGTAEEIAEFCSVNFGVIFPLFAKTDVNGPDRHPVFSRPTETADAAGEAGDVKWNFEKFLISPHGAVAGRFRSQVEPHDADPVAAIEAVLLRRPGASGHDGVRRLASPPTP